MMTLKILRAARALYEQAPAHTAPYEWPDEACYCPLAALSEGGASPFDPAADRLRTAMDETSSIAEWNATHTTSEVLAAFDRAILTELGLAKPAGASL